MKMFRLPIRLFITSALLILSTAGCERDGVTVSPENADEWAAFAANATGSSATWDQARYLAFTFAVAREGNRGAGRTHLWDRKTGRYRLSWQTGQDTVVTALFNTATRSGKVFFNDELAPEPDQEKLMEQAFTRYINDTYWLLLPLKMNDSGVSRTLVPDSSTAETVVIKLTFDGVGITPGDTYWVHINRESGDVTSWSYVLESNRDGSATSWIWAPYTSFSSHGGELRLSTAKNRAGTGATIFTDAISFPETVPSETFTDV